MRIVSGQHKGKAIVAPPGEATRWTLEQAYRHPDSTLFLRYRRAATEKGRKEPGLGTMIG